jgi:hypothetical protein
MPWSPAAGDKNKVRQAIQTAIAALEADTPVVRQAMRSALEPADEAARQVLRRKFLAELRAAAQALETERTPQPGEWFSAHTPLIGLVQSSMAAASELAEQATEEVPRFEDYGTLDPRWAECLFDAWKTSFAGDAPFRVHQSLSDFLSPLPDTGRVALMADWGGFNQAAANVAAQIRNAAPDIVIHLGDIYYAGQKNECEKFLAHWPLAASTGTIPPGSSYALNGNHEMFSGARPYFELVLPKLGQKASYFGLRNTYWQILAMDTAYVSHKLPDPAEAAQAGVPLVGRQWEWLADKLRNAGPRQTILLSHHQPISAFEDAQSAGAALKKNAEDLFAAAAVPGVFAWFFGHEHQCVIYRDGAAPYRARLIGNGCIPHAPAAPNPACAPVQAINNSVRPDGVAQSGFVLLNFAGPTIALEYRNEDGTLFHAETWRHPGS